MIHGYWCNAKTFPLKCRYCGLQIFYFSCDHESKVFFDELGPPWPIHDCQSKRASVDTKPSIYPQFVGINLLPGSANTSGLLPGFRRANDAIEDAIVKRAQTSSSQYRESLRIEPLGDSPELIIGIVHDRSVPNLSKRHNLPRNGMGYSDLAKHIGDPDPVQLTVLVDELPSDPAAIDYSSYTFLCPKSLVNRRINKGVLVKALIEPIEPFATSRIWLCKEIERLH